MDKVYLNAGVQHELGAIYTPNLDHSAWRKRDVKVVELIQSIFPPALALQVLMHLQLSRSGKDYGQYQSNLGISFISGGRKFFLEADQTNPEHSRFINLLRGVLVHSYPETVTATDGVLPEKILIAIKGSGSQNTSFLARELNSNSIISGYGAKDGKDMSTTHLIAGKYEVDGRQFVIPPSRIHLAAIEIDAFNLIDTGEHISLVDENPDMPIATGENRLAISIMAELFGPDLNAVQIELSNIHNNVGEKRSQGLVNYIKKHLVAHPFFNELCQREMDSDIWLREYLKTLLEYCYLKSRALADKIVPGENRTTQNYDLALEYRDLDDTLLPLISINPDSEELSRIYLLNFSMHLDEHLNGFKALAEKVLKIRCEELLANSYIQNPQNIYEALWNHKVLKFNSQNFDYLGEIQRGEAYFLPRLLGFTDSVFDLEMENMNLGELAPYLNLTSLQFNELLVSRIDVERHNNYLSLRSTAKRMKIEGVNDFADILEPLKRTDHQKIAEIYIFKIFELLINQSINISRICNAKRQEFIKLCEIFDTSIMSYFRSRWSLSETTSSKMRDLCQEYVSYFGLKDVERIYERILA